MGMSSLKLLKYVLFFFNLLFWFCGCCILGFGVYLMIHNNFGVLFHNFPSLTLGNVFVIVGSIIMVVAFLGCMGSIKENKCLLMSFFVLLLIILFAEVTLVILLSVYEQKGCYVKAMQWFYSNFLYIGIVIIFVCVIQVLGMSFALTLSCQIDKTSQAIGL
ncbi:leukocyte surface antigen CD53 isoform X2 [Carlito syrichta]|uniref:Leukocyte surface antigen CD53 isoform X2 n=1 Tax=Carlito syrichta TaxID=1868482 RepID=A0A3Q0EID9_CARSF|nr:leukocyte surface antigen CD53 isoform X2 [Carlito syrichta]